MGRRDARSSGDGRGRLAARALGASVALAAISLCGLWAIGQAVGDRLAWSQWLFWIPTGAPLLAALAACAVALARSRRRGALIWLSVALLLAARLLLVEHRPRPSAPAPAGPAALRVLHCNMHWPSPRDSPAVRDFVLSRPEEVVILTEPGYLLANRRGKEIEAAGWTVLRMGRYAVFTKLPVLEMRMLVKQEGTDITLLRLDASAHGTESVLLWLVDLPSNPLRGRMRIATRLRALLDELEAAEPDLVVGDMNMTDGPALRTLFPAMRDAWREAGRGWGGSWPEPIPLWRIDHLLLGDRLRAADFAYVPTGLSRHRAQIAKIAPR